MSNTKIFIPIFIGLFFFVNFTTSPGYGCDLTNDTGYKGTTHNGRPVSQKTEQRVQDAICEAIQDIETCRYLNDFQKDKIRSNRGKKFPFTIEFASISGYGIAYYKGLNYLCQKPQTPHSYV